MVFKIRFIQSLAFALSLIAAISANAQHATDTFFDIRKTRHFGATTETLIEYLKDEPAPLPGQQHFCIVGYQDTNKNRWAYVHWHEGSRLIRWEGTSELSKASASIRNARFQLDLKADVVKTKLDIKGSTYLVTEAWAAKVINDCARHGNQYAIQVPKMIHPHAGQVETAQDAQR